MKTISKVLVMLMIAVSAFVIMPDNMVFAEAKKSTGGTDPKSVVSSVNVKNPDADYSSDLAGKIGQLLGFLQVASGLVAILMIAIVGFNYIISTPDVKEEMKKKMLPIIIGLVLVFGAVSVAKFILAVVGG